MRRAVAAMFVLNTGVEQAAWVPRLTHTFLIMPERSRGALHILLLLIAAVQPARTAHAHPVRGEGTCPNVTLHCTENTTCTDNGCGTCCRAPAGIPPAPDPDGICCHEPGSLCFVNRGNATCAPPGSKPCPGASGGFCLPSETCADDYLCLEDGQAYCPGVPEQYCNSGSQCCDGQSCGEACCGPSPCSFRFSGHCCEDTCCWDGPGPGHFCCGNVCCPRSTSPVDPPSVCVAPGNCQPPSCAPEGILCPPAGSYPCCADLTCSANFTCVA